MPTARPSGPGSPPAPRGRPQRQPMGISRPGEGPTTGLIVSPEGHILTSTFNFIRRQQIITVVLHDGTQHVAKLLGRDDTRKLCLLKIQVDRPLPVPTWVDPATLQVGQWAISVGLGYGEDQPALSVGIISGLNRIFGKAVQTDANISPANYGGPLLDYQGRVIGICVPLSPQSTDLAAGVEWYDSGIGFAIPVHGEPAWLAALQRNEHLQPGRMGVQITPAPVVGGGVHVRSVLPKSAAQQAGLRPGDLILAVDDRTLEDPADLRAILGRKLAGDAVRLQLRRDAKELTVSLTLESGHEESATPPATQPTTQPDTQPDNSP